MAVCNETFPDLSCHTFFTFLSSDLAADWHNQSCSCPAFDESSSQTFVQYIYKSWALWERKEASHLPQF